MFLLLYIHFCERNALRRDTGKQRQAIRNESEIQEVCWRIWGETARKEVSLSSTLGLSAVSGRESRRYFWAWTCLIIR